jgi:coatomer subunit beta
MQTQIQQLISFLLSGIFKIDYREAMEKFAHLRAPITHQILDTFMEMNTGKVLRGALWIIGEYASDCSCIQLFNPAIEMALAKIRQSIGPIPILAAEEQAALALESPVENSEEPRLKSPVKNRVLADGTYASESAYIARKKSIVATANTPIKSMLLLNKDLFKEGEFFVGTLIAACLTKLCIRYATLCTDAVKVNAFKTNVFFIFI